MCRGRIDHHCGDRQSDWTVVRCRLMFGERIISTVVVAALVDPSIGKVSLPVNESEKRWFWDCRFSEYEDSLVYAYPFKG